LDPISENAENLQPISANAQQAAQPEQRCAAIINRWQSSKAVDHGAKSLSQVEREEKLKAES